MTAEELVEAIRAVPAVDYCDCGRPLAEHKFWEDRVHGYTGLDCPKASWRTEYRFNKKITEREHKKAQAAVVTAARAVIAEREKGAA